MDTGFKKEYLAFVQFAATRSQQDYNELWIICWQTMRALCFARYGSRSDSEDLDDIINNATLRVLAKLSTAQDITTKKTAQIFYWSLRDAASKIFSKKIRRQKIMAKYIKDAESAARIIFNK